MKNYQVTKTIKGTEYTAQFNGISAALDAIDRSYIDGTSNTSMRKLAEHLLKHVIVSPTGLTIDSFESMEEFNEVIAFGSAVMKGDFREETDENATKKAGKK